MADNSYPFCDFVAVHGDQLRMSGVPEHFWEVLHVKLKEEVFDAGLVFQLMQVEDEDGDCVWMTTVAHDQSINVQDQQHIYLIDHAWTYQAPFARKHLTSIEGLVERVAALMDLPVMDSSQEQLIEDVLSRMWRYNQTYNFSGFASDCEDDSTLEPLWYIMDEFGSRVQHSDEPSVRIVPFFYGPKRCAFSIMWPIKNLEDGDEVCRDYVHGLVGENRRQAKLVPWLVFDTAELPYNHVPRDDEYFKRFSGGEKVPETPPPPPIMPGVLKVYSEMSQVCNNLDHPRFQVVDSQNEAQVWWLREHFKDYKDLARVHPNTFINQFPNEMLITVKDPLAVVCRRARHQGQGNGEGPRWLPVTYNLCDEMPEFVSYFQHRERLGLDNHWICKPWNLARGLDIHVSNNLDQLVRVNESGPKVACKYIHDPVLFRRKDLDGEPRVKFDIRYIVLLASTSPLKLYAYKVFWLRFANKPYSLEELDDYEKHFTVMNYQNPEKLCQINYDDFIPMFEEQYPEHPWREVEERIFSMFRELFGAASCEAYPRGLPPSPQSRAMYAVDLMLSWDRNNAQGKEPAMEPMLCEVNFCPDCERACKYHPNFYNDVFSTLFLGETEGRPVQEL